MKDVFIVFARRAEKDLARLGHRENEHLLAEIDSKLSVHPPEGDIKALVGRAPWRRLRIGHHRIVFRTLNSDELRVLASGKAGEPPRNGVLVAMVVDRSDLVRAIRNLR